MSNLEELLEQVLREDAPIRLLKLCMQIAGAAGYGKTGPLAELAMTFVVIDSEVDFLLVGADDSLLSDDNRKARNERAAAYASRIDSEVKSTAEAMLRLIRGTGSDPS